MQGPRRRLREAEGFDKLRRLRLLRHLVGRHNLPAIMNAPPLWFERKFEFTFPVEQHPNLCARLRGAPARLEEIVRGARHDVLVSKPGEKWSAQEHAGHLADLEPLWMARVDDYMKEASQLTVADLSNRKTSEAQHNRRPIDRDPGRIPKRPLTIDEPSGENRPCDFRSHLAPSAAENTHAAGGSSVLCGGAR